MDRLALISLKKKISESGYTRFQEKEDWFVLNYDFYDFFESRRDDIIVAQEMTTNK